MNFRSIADFDYSFWRDFWSSEKRVERDTTVEMVLNLGEGIVSVVKDFDHFGLWVEDVKEFLVLWMGLALFGCFFFLDLDVIFFHKIWKSLKLYFHLLSRVVRGDLCGCRELILPP